MKRFLKVLLRILTVLVALILVVFGIRVINGFRYPAGPEQPAANDPAGYPLDQPGMKVTHITGRYLNGFHLRPHAITHKGVVVVFGGSDGSPNYHLATAVAKQGYEVLALFFFGLPNQEAALARVPIDFFDEVVTWIDKSAESARPLTVMGASKGAELSLVLASRYPRIDNVVVYTPTTHVYQGLNYREPSSSWSYQGKEVPYISFERAAPQATAAMFAGMLLNYPAPLRATYETALANTADADKALISLDSFKGNLLAFAGDADAMWQGDTAARELQQRRPNKTEAFVYPGAGHIFALDRSYAGPFEVGGTAEANRKAFDESNRILTERLATWHR